LDWQLSQHLAPAALVVGELVMNAITHAESDIELTVSAYRQTIRIAVRDQSPDLPIEPLAGGSPVGD
jgi:anti-sigma regulatory factor (Ser/Thr protein kinase)